MFDPAVARRIRLLGLDVDGVLTDNALFIGQVKGERAEFKRFDVQDGVGVVLLRKTDIRLAIVSGRASAATTLRMKELGIDDVVQDSSARKLPAFEALLARHGLSWDETAFVGDDAADLPLLTRVGLSIAVANARPEVKQVAAYVTHAEGGHGAVREVIDHLLRARGEFERVLNAYLEERGEHRDRLLGTG